mgnify:FL=1|tara:strand:+ start:1272 stop:1847 length:576 start_codon:yes stop_codon:yes gene_type:complete
MRNLLSFLSLVLFSSYLIGFLNKESEANYYGDYKNQKYYEYLDAVGKEIMNRVDNSEKVIYIPKENTPYCKNNPGYAAYVDWPNRNGTDFVICTLRITRGNSYENSYSEINDAVRHEAVHSAQFCRYTSFDDYLLYPLGIVDKKTLLKYKKFVSSEIYDGIPYHQRLAEMEANYLEDKPYTVLTQLNKYCY